jgi:hypothetical protein
LSERDLADRSDCPVSSNSGVSRPPTNAPPFGEEQG